MSTHIPHPLLPTLTRSLYATATCLLALEQQQQQPRFHPPIPNPSESNFTRSNIDLRHSIDHCTQSNTWLCSAYRVIIKHPVATTQKTSSLSQTPLHSTQNPAPSTTNSHTPYTVNTHESCPKIKMRQTTPEVDKKASIVQTEAEAAALTRAYKFSNGFLATWLVTASVESGYQFGPHSRHRVGYVNTNEYVGMAQYLSAQSDSPIPSHVVNRLDNIISLRKQVRDLHLRLQKLDP